MELKEGLFAGIVAGMCIGVFLSLNLAAPDQTLESFTVQKMVTSLVIWSVVLGIGGILGSSVDHILKKDSWNTMAVAVAVYIFLFYYASTQTVGTPTGMKPNAFPIMEMLIGGVSAAFGYNHMLRRGTPIERPASAVKQENLFEFSPIQTETGLPSKTLECYKMAKALGGTALMTDSSSRIRVDHPFVTEIIFDEISLAQKLLNPNFVFGLPGIAIFEFPQEVKIRIKEAMAAYRHYYCIRARSLNRFPTTEFYGGLFSSENQTLSEKLNEGDLMKALLQARVYYVKLKGDRLTIIAASKDRPEMLVKALQLLQKTLDGKGFYAPKAEEPVPAASAVAVKQPTPAPEGKIHREEMVKELVRAAKPERAIAPPPLPKSPVVQKLIQSHAPASFNRQYAPAQPKAEELLPMIVSRPAATPVQAVTAALKPQEKKDFRSMIWSGGPLKKPEEKKKPEEEKKPTSGIRAIPLRQHP